MLDFGQNLTGYVEVKVRGVRGSRIVMHHAEVLDKDGNELEVVDGKIVGLTSTKGDWEDNEIIFYTAGSLAAQSVRLGHLGDLGGHRAGSLLRRYRLSLQLENLEAADR